VSALSGRDRDGTGLGGGAGFATTRWSLVRAAGRRASPEAERALAALCETYWYPLYAYARRRGLDAEAAGDATQGFFARLLEKGDLAVADRTRGRFRSFLLAAFGHYLANERDRERALRRGGGRPTLSLDFDAGESRYGLEPADEATPERIFDRRWALTLLDRAFARLRDEYGLAGKGDLFEALRPALAGDRGAPYVEVAARLGMTEGAVKVAAHRLRSRCGEVIRAEIAETVGSAEEVEDELRQLFAALGP
jgi:DNA-directed RNA polymerase specialized sigma24 family protein